MKKLELTDDELRTLIWAVNNQFHRYLKLRQKDGKQGLSIVQERLLSISKKANRELVH